MKNLNGIGYECEYQNLDISESSKLNNLDNNLLISTIMNTYIYFHPIQKLLFMIQPNVK